jgi:hypothetical protein
MSDSGIRGLCSKAPMHGPTSAADIEIDRLSMN